MNQPSASFWSWDTTVTPPFLNNYAQGYPTKTGLQVIDLQNFIGVPTVINANPPVELSTDQLQGLLRQAEDWVEQNSGVLLTQTWIASPPPISNAQALTAGILTTSNSVSGQVLGVDFDLADIGYDFYYRRFLMEGWGIQQLRYRPLKQVYNLAFIYPLLSQFFNVPLSWVITDQDAGMVRLVPAANVQMLPLFAMQLAFMGFATSLPQALWYQYSAGLDANDYATRFSFMKTLVLATAAVWTLNILQGSINFGTIRRATSVDGLRYEQAWPNSGAAYAGLISSFTRQRDELLRSAIDLVRGAPAFISL
jgi:hypothetical protein